MPVRILVGQPTRSDGRTTPIHGQPWGLVDLIRWTQITNTFIRCLEKETGITPLRFGRRLPL